MTTFESVVQPKSKLWLAAIKPPMYTVAIIPITVGSAVAYAQTQAIDLNILGTFLLSAIAIIAWLNISNDVYDSDTGIDINKAESVVNLTGNRNLMFWLGNLFLGLGITGIATISWWQQDLTVVEIVLLSCFLGYSYQGPPFRLGYQGLGEIICTICFGPLALSAAYYSQTQSWSIANLLASLVIGISTSIILFCSHFHQVKDDLAAGKLSPIVRMGTKIGAVVLKWSTASIYALSAVGVASGLFPVATLLIFLSLPLAIKLTNFVSEYHDRPERVRTCKYLAVRLHFASGLLLAVGFYL
ncbi:2-carboxy-1,4-naphthoquinone phytyltransferase [Chamaesiphon minutus]|uniref:2-carboxy-1,4-naphthoquinone phytyltransferase n=1 Tax=Chamaesiphon minutus (strain ATCC 27169 / PCC 6605) TaxID=1173020 RepID=K9UH44_CHAP6|nr:2-carboxy-1,4-naphthoquinone phytyltransferase [Chamaesiphon minutus]AFY93968.1 1,4-dihydroxy-2-naphthoate phytyltransferase [Chamaesiphon minutus PCC 6605]